MNTLVTLLKALNRLIPKDENQVVFSSSPNTLSDNPKALYDYMVLEFGGSYRLLWVVPGDKHDFYLKNSPFDVISTRGLKNGLKGMYQLFRSKYIVTSSNDYTGLSSSNQILVNLWHGMECAAIKNSQLVLTINQKLEEFVRKLGAVNTKVIDAGIDLEEFDPGLDGTPVRREYGIKDEDTVLFFMM